MKTLKNIFVLTLSIVNCSLLIAQNNVFVTAGRTKVLEFKVPGNYTSYTLLFVAKADTSISSDRLIQKTLSKSYSAPYTALTCTLYVTDTQDLTTNASYVYDITAYGADTVTVKQGQLNISSAVQTSFDGTNLPADGTRITTVSLDNGTAAGDIAIWNTTSASYTPISIDSLRTLIFNGAVYFTVEPSPTVPLADPVDPVDVVDVIISGYGGTHDDDVANAFRSGYLLSGNAFADSLELRAETLFSSFVYASVHNTKMVIRSTTGLSSYISLQQSYYPIQLVMPAGSNDYVQIFNSGGSLPAAISTGAGDLANETGYDIEFYSNDPITTEPTDLSSFSNGYIAGAIYAVATHANGNIWTARYLLRQALGNSWTNTNGYGKITEAIVLSAIALYNPLTDYSLLDPYN